MNSKTKRIFSFELTDSAEVSATNSTKEVKDRAWEFLMKEKSTIFTEQGEETCRHHALHLYMSRLVKPIWDLPIMARQSLKSLKGLRSNSDLIIPIAQKLNNLYLFIENNKSYLHGQQNSQEDDKMSLIEKQQLSCLLLSLERCDDILKFIHFIEDDAILSKLGQNLAKDHQEQFGAITFGELMSASINELVQAVIVAAIKIRTSESHSLMMDEELKQIQSDCRTFFMTGTNHAHLGETLLQRASLESDEINRNKLKD